MYAKLARLVFPELLKYGDVYYLEYVRHDGVLCLCTIDANNW